MILQKYSFGIGDRFGRQGKAQLAAIIEAAKLGVDIAPVWNKSYREHSLVGTTQADVRREADEAVGALEWKEGYYVDADHIGLKNVDQFIEASDFFTIDVADFIGQVADEADVKGFVARYKRYVGSPEVRGIDEKLHITQEDIVQAARKFLPAVRQAGAIYRHIEKAKGKGCFVTEISMDETDQPQKPVELLFILAAIADEGIPAQTIAPKFTGRFNKGVDYVGDVKQFAREFEQDLAVVRFAVKEFGLAANLKLSVHSGSDKFSIYGAINRAIKKFDAGLHIKTAGTTWLEELAGLAMAEGKGLDIARKIYAAAFGRFDELCRPYLTVVDIDRGRLPEPREVDRWTGQEFAEALRHNQECRRYNPNLRQLLHVGYKVAAEMSREYLDAVEQNQGIISKTVTENIFERHIGPIFIG